MAATHEPLCPVYREGRNPRCGCGEIKAVRKVIRLLRGQGWEIDGVHDGDEVHPLTTGRDAMALLFDLDEGRLCLHHFDRIAHVFFVFGNAADGSEVVADYTCNIDRNGFDLLDATEA